MSASIRISSMAAIAALGLCLWLPASEMQAAESWEWSITPYLPAYAAGVQVKEDGVVVKDDDASFSDIFNTLDFAFSVHVEGRRQRAGVLFDLFYIDLSDDGLVPEHDDPEAPPPGSLIEVDLKQLILEGGGFYRFSGEESGLEAIFGIRWISVDEVLDLTLSIPFPPGPHDTKKSSATYTDGFVGLRYIGRINDKWDFTVRGDIATGGTKLTLNGQGTLNYQVGQSGKYALTLGYRYFDMQFEDREEGVLIETDVALFGPVLGFRFKL